MRENTERPEKVDDGTVRLVGTRREPLVEEIALLLDSPDQHEAMANAVNLYDAGHAFKRMLVTLNGLRN